VAPPFSLEAELRACGALYRCGPAGLSFVARDGPMITGQNPASAAAAAEALLAVLGSRNA
jgi:putative intracellular protease/amidase